MVEVQPNCDINLETNSSHPDSGKGMKTGLVLIEISRWPRLDDKFLKVRVKEKPCSHYLLAIPGRCTNKNVVNLITKSRWISLNVCVWSTFFLLRRRRESKVPWRAWKQSTSYFSRQNDPSPRMQPLQSGLDIQCILFN